MYGAEELILVYHAPVAVVDDHAVANGRSKCHQHLYLVTHLHGERILVVDVWLNLVGSYAATRAVIYVHVDYGLLTRYYATLLVTVRQEEMLAEESPIEECTMQVLIYNLQCSDLTHLDKGFLGCCNGTVIRVVVHKYLNAITNLHIEFNETVRKQHLNTLTISEI
jgi:hypothetical protein